MNDIRFEIGGQLMYAENHSQPGTGVVPTIPNYLQYEYGLYSIVRYHKEKFGSEAGVRYDYQTLNADGIDWTGDNYGGKHKFGSPSCFVGIHYDIIENLIVKINSGISWRPPHWR